MPVSVTEPFSRSTPHGQQHRWSSVSPNCSRISSPHLISPHTLHFCFQLTVSGSGSGTPSNVNFPGAYGASDPGSRINIYALLKYILSRTNPLWGRHPLLSLLPKRGIPHSSLLLHLQHPVNEYRRRMRIDLSCVQCDECSVTYIGRKS
jgi:hypothetical protein